MNDPHLNPSEHPSDLPLQRKEISSPISEKIAPLPTKEVLTIDRAIIQKIAHRSPSAPKILPEPALNTTPIDPLSLLELDLELLEESFEEDTYSTDDPETDSTSSDSSATSLPGEIPLLVNDRASTVALREEMKALAHLRFKRGKEEKQNSVLREAASLHKIIRKEGYTSC